MTTELPHLRTMLNTLLAPPRSGNFVSQVTLFAEDCLALARLKEQPVNLLEAYGYVELAERALHALAAHLQAAIANESWPELASWPAGPGKRVVEQLLLEGKLNREYFPRLQAKLRTADHFRTPNPTLVATFGLYVNGATREAIAQALGCSIFTTRHYISVIYQHFDIASNQALGSHLRRQQLLILARACGYISES